MSILRAIHPQRSAILPFLQEKPAGYAWFAADASAAVTMLI